MKLVAQRGDEDSRNTGINAFRYLHGAYAWEGTPPAGLGYGMLVESHVPIPAGGNSVLSFLEVTAPDDTSKAQVIRAFSVMYDTSTAPPFEYTYGNVTIQGDMIRAYRLAWRWEELRLFDAILGIASA